MKKLLVLMLVLAMAPVASAITGSIVIDSGTSWHVTIAGSYADPYLIVAIDTTYAATLAGFTKGGNAPSDSISFGTTVDAGVGYLGQGEVWAMADMSSPYTYSDGTWLTGTASGTALVDGAGVAYMWLYESPDGSTINLLDTVYVPEPMTLVLLGLGGLFLRRRN